MTSFRINMHRINIGLTDVFLPADTEGELVPRRVNGDFLDYSRIPLGFWNAGFNALNLRGTKTGSGPLMFWSGEFGAYRALELRDGSVCRGPPFAGRSRGSHGFEGSLCQIGLTRQSQRLLNLGVRKKRVQILSVEL